ncbi:N-acetylneuraminate synthase [Candidatus Propionivibrio aalborgensis]|uniref:N-acetylneuraminate synthase n=1 Tax=Candidatus Propionivibrio aalborgensis TaxID=1860101 RepID=A0A1A8XWK2_9RHOO|nr:N-acetylneuraminate synthase family protein [Candidatus Propionivibrio aalborgensis]SBT09375.1 N-acetylneuraminate synthase [Candidatus Propionivibrio aalborgensis]
MPQIIAEIGSVHDGSFGNARKLVELAADCGADVVKFQTHIAEAETLANAPTPPYFQGEPRLEYFRRIAFTEAQWNELRAVCADMGVTFLSSPFSLEAVDLLERVGVDAYKIPSGEVTNLPLLEKIAATGKPALLSSGMSNWDELDRAVAALKVGGPVTVLQCTSAYPCPPERVGLNVIDEMKARYGLPVGYSDHTESCAAAFAAAAMGATVIEKHLTFSRRMYGSDAANAMEPDGFTAYCSGLREIWAMWASPIDKGDIEPFRDMKQIFEKSIVSSRPLKAGETICMADLCFKKPGDGISAADYRELIGRVVSKDLPPDHKFSADDFSVLASVSK